MKPVAIALGLLVALVHYGYYFFEDQPEAFYALNGLQGAALFALVGYLYSRYWPLVFVCVWGVLENIQVFACGWSDVIPGQWSGMCMELVGPAPYAVAAATAITYLLTLKKNV